MATLAETFFARFRDGGWDFFQGLKETEWEESLYVDFKCKGNPSGGAMDSGDRARLSEGLSGFANADGGILVWGVHAKANAEGIDKVVSLQPITGLKRFVSDLRGLSPQLTSDPVGGVEHVPIADPNDPDKGYAVTLVPRSDATPHMATGKDLRKYFRRVGRSFMPMAHHEIADMFGRRPHPLIRLRVYHEIWKVPDGDQLIVFFMLENHGGAIAHNPCLTIGPIKSETVRATTSHVSVWAQFTNATAPHGWWFRAVGLQNMVLYPGDRFIALRLILGNAELGAFTVECEATAEWAAPSRTTYALPLIDLDLGRLTAAAGLQYRSDDHPDRPG
jgi:hypothetical protein